MKTGEQEKNYWKTGKQASWRAAESKNSRARTGKKRVRTGARTESRSKNRKQEQEDKTARTRVHESKRAGEMMLRTGGQ